MGRDQSRALLAVVISGFILITWNYFFVPSTEQSQFEIESKKTQSREYSLGVKSKVAQTQKREGGEQSGTLPREVREHVLLDNNSNSSYKVDDSLAVREVKTNYAEAHFSTVVGSQMPFELLIPHNGSYVKPYFQFQQESATELKGEDRELGISATLDLLETGKLHLRISSKNPIKPRLVLNGKGLGALNEGGESVLGFSLPGTGSYKSSRRFVFLAKNLNEIVVGSSEEGEVQARWLGIDSHYHLFALTFPERRSIRYQSRESGHMVVDFNQETSMVEGNFVFAKKNYDLLNSLGEGLHLGVDFGFFSLIAIPLFKALQIFHDFIPNWGIAIILLTVLIRLVTFPLYYKSMKSMNRMKKIQPHLQKIKEKFKDDTRRQQMETMELFKREGVNPMGGCLPIVLQMPVFIAFYKVLTVSAELDNMPFLGWITSLTEKDPYYILPVLVTFLMWLNQKAMPQASTDPTQQRIMSIMPLIFGFIFLSMPAGLNLYILVSTGFGILQQIFVNNRMEQARA